MSPHDGRPDGDPPDSREDGPAESGGDAGSTRREGRDRRETALDAALAGLALLAVVLGGAVAGARPSLPAGVLGACGVPVLEVVLGRHHGRVRRVWRRPAVKALTVLVGAFLAAAGLRVAPTRTASLLAGGLAAYLLLVALVAAGAVAPPRDWTVRD